MIQDLKKMLLFSNFSLNTKVFNWIPCVHMGISICISHFAKKLICWKNMVKLPEFYDSFRNLGDYWEGTRQLACGIEAIYMAAKN